MPYYDLDKIKQLILRGAYDPVNDRVDRTLVKLDWTDEHLAELILGLDPKKDFDKCAPLCLARVPGGKIDCDQYEIYWVNARMRRYHARQFDSGVLAYSLKLAIASDSKGDFVAVVTFHLSGEP